MNQTEQTIGVLLLGVFRLPSMMYRIPNAEDSTFFEEAKTEKNLTNVIMSKAVVLYPSMSITLKPEQTAMIQELMADGSFQNADEVLQAALVLLVAERKAHLELLDETRHKVDEGIAALDRGEKVDGETFVNGLLKQLQQAKQS